MSDPVPLSMQWRFKELKKILKETVPMTANNGQTSVKPGQRVIVDLPFNSTVDLATFAWFLKVKQLTLVHLQQAHQLVRTMIIAAAVSFHVIPHLLFNLCK